MDSLLSLKKVGKTPFQRNVGNIYNSAPSLTYAWCFIHRAQTIAAVSILSTVDHNDTPLFPCTENKVFSSGVNPPSGQMMPCIPLSAHQLVHSSRPSPSKTMPPEGISSLATSAIVGIVHPHDCSTASSIIFSSLARLWGAISVSNDLCARQKQRCSTPISVSFCTISSIFSALFGSAIYMVTGGVFSGAVQCSLIVARIWSFVICSQTTAILSTGAVLDWTTHCSQGFILKTRDAWVTTRSSVMRISWSETIV